MRPSPGFAARVLQLPFLPSLWRSCAGLGLADVLLPLLVIVFGANVCLSFVMIPRVKDGAYEAATYYDANADPLLYEEGRLRLDGLRIFHYTDADTTILIDPEHTVTVEDVETSQLFVVRADEITLKQTGQRPDVYVVEDFAEIFEALGPGPILDGQRIRDLADAWIPPMVGAGIALGRSLFELTTCLFYALIAGLLLMLVRGQWLGLDFAACYRVALATSSSTVVLGLLLAIAGTGTGIPGIVLWPVLMTGLGMLALAGSRAETGRIAA